MCETQDVMPRMFPRFGFADSKGGRGLLRGLRENAIVVVLHANTSLGRYLCAGELGVKFHI